MRDGTLLITETGCPDEARPPSGRAVRDRKLLVTEVHRFDLSELRRRGVFDQPETIRTAIWTWPWNPAIRSVIHYALITRGARPAAFAIAHQDPNTGDWASYLLWLDWTTCHFGGQRPWLLCPGETEDLRCGRRVRILYRPLGAERLLCRHCARLTYRCRRLSRQRGEAVWKALDLLNEVAASGRWTPRSRRRRARLLRKMRLAERNLERFLEKRAAG